MPPVSAIILHREPPPDAGSLEWLLAAARLVTAERQRRGLLAAGAADARVVAGPPDALTFGERLGHLLAAGTAERRGVVVLGAGSVPLATRGDLRRFVRAAGGETPGALTNNAYSADVVAIARADLLPPLPPLPADNALPRWLVEVAGWPVRDLGDRWRLQVDIDGPLDVLLASSATVFTGRADAVNARLAAIGAVLDDPRAELVVAGRTGSRTLRWLERKTRCRVRALIEERGLRAASALAQSDAAHGPGRAQRPPRSVLGLLLDRDGPGALGRHLATLGDAALVDSRVLLAHRLGPEEAAWPSAEDRFASDLLDAEAIADPWLRELTASARDAGGPVLLGGHSLVGPGVRLVARAARADRADRADRTRGA